MKIQMLTNGVDSLKTGFKAFLKYEENTVNKMPTQEDYLILKHAALSVHHGVEILMKCVLTKQSEFLIVSRIDEDYLKAYQNKVQQNKNSVFETALADKVHTITYSEALARVKYLTKVSLSKAFVDKLNKLNDVRNALTHAEIDIPDDEIIEIFQSLFDDIDIFFFKALGVDYSTLTGYGELKQNYEEYKKYLVAKGMTLKEKVVDAFSNALEKQGYAVGEESVIHIEEINKAKAIVARLSDEKFNFGMDMFNFYNSGDVEIKIVDDCHFSIYARDSHSEYIFKLKSMIVYFPKVKSSMSPIIVFESDDDDSMNQKYSNYIIEDVDEGRSLSGISFDEENPPRITFDHKEINEFYAKVEYDDTFIVPKYHTIDYYLTHEIFACVNVQGLGYWNFGKFLMRTRGKDGQWVKVNMRQIEN